MVVAAGYVRVQVTLDPGTVHEEILDRDLVFTDPALYRKFRNILCDGILKFQHPVFNKSENAK